MEDNKPENEQTVDETKSGDHQSVKDNKPEDEQTIDETKSGDYQTVEDNKPEKAQKVEADKEDQKREAMEDNLVDVIYQALESLL